MYLPAKFNESRPALLHGLIQAHPLGTVITHGAAGLDANHVPFEIDAASADAPHGILRAHVARRNDLWRQDGADVLVVFQGPSAYITPTLYDEKAVSGKVVPTYHYAVVHAHGKLRTIEDPAWMLALLEQQTARNEAGRAAPWAIHDAQRMIAKGVCDRPTSDDYILGLMGCVRTIASTEGLIRDMVAADPGLLDGTLLRLFDIEGNDDVSLAKNDRNLPGGQSWSDVLADLAVSGKLSRQALIDKSLQALEHDWAPTRALWHSQFHDKLAPTLAEMVPHAARYLRLCASRNSPTVGLAVTALATLQKAGKLDHAALVSALAPVLTSASKGQVDGALKLLDQAVKAVPGLAHDASAHAARALAHPAADLHKKNIARLSAWGFDEPARDTLRAMMSQVSAQHQDALAALIGAAPARPAVAEATPMNSSSGVLSPLDPSRRLVPLDDPDALVQVIARVFENDQLIDDLEQALDAIARMAPRLPAQRERFSPVLKRARVVVAGRRDVAAALARVLIFAFKPGELPEAAVEDLAVAELSRRVADLCALIATGSGLSALSNATHGRGFVDPAVLVERIGAHAANGVNDSTGEHVRALLRLAPGPSPEALRHARTLEQTPFVQAVRYALGDSVAIGEERALFAAAARIRHPEADDAAMLAAYGNLGPDGPAVARYEWKLWRGFAVEVAPAPVDGLPGLLAARRHIGRSGRFCYLFGDRAVKLYAASILPSSLEKFFHKGADEVGNNMDWRSQAWDDEVYIGMLIDPTVPATAGAVMLLAFALGAKQAGQATLAVDALVAMATEGRLAGEQVAAKIRWILLSTLGKASRYTTTLAAAAAAHPAMPGVVVAMLCEIVDIGEAEAPGDTGALLTLLAELVIANNLALPAGARDTIALLKVGGKGKVAQKALLAR